MSYNQDDIAKLVRRVVTRTMGDRTRRVIIDEDTVRRLPPGSNYPVPAGALVTPLARQIALEQRIDLVRETQASTGSVQGKTIPAYEAERRDSGKQFVALGADHGGFEMKEMLKEFVAAAGYDVIDCGTHSKDSVDYPDFAYAVARLVSEGRAWRGIIVDGAGIGSCMVANKVPGVRAAMCYDQATAVNSREHNNANVLTLGAGLIGANLAKQIVDTWLKTEFGGGRHARRVDKIDDIGRRFMKG